MADTDPRRFLSGAGAAALILLALGATGALAATATYTVRRGHELSAPCRGQNAEVEQAVDQGGRYAYEEWIGCNGIGLARSTDGGLHFRKPIMLRGSADAWDPALTVAANGTVYAAFMVTKRDRSYPVVEASFDHGVSFPRVTSLIPSRKNNWGDREFIAAGPNNTLYVSWDYGPSDPAVKLRCPSDGSCATTAGDLNVVMQVSTDGGKRFGPMSHVSPGFPASGAGSAPLLVEPSGKIDVLYQRFPVTRRKTHAFGPGHSYFTSSTDQGRTWTHPVKVGGSAGGMSPLEWWIDGAIAIDAAGNLYASWDTQNGNEDIGWLSYSTDGGVTWSGPVRVARGLGKAAHIVQVAGGPAGIAYVAWLWDKRPKGYAEYLRTFSIAQGWLSQPRHISHHFGDPRVWPGDTFGISALTSNDVLLSWGSAIPSTRGRSEIFAALVSVTVR